MAKVTTKCVSVEKVVSTYETRVTLELTEAEAETLLLVTRYVGGLPGDTPRGHINAIRAALLGNVAEHHSAKVKGTITLPDKY